MPLSTLDLLSAGLASPAGKMGVAGQGLKPPLGSRASALRKGYPIAAFDAASTGNTQAPPPPPPYREKYYTPPPRPQLAGNISVTPNEFDAAMYEGWWPGESRQGTRAEPRQVRPRTQPSAARPAREMRRERRGARLHQYDYPANWAQAPVVGAGVGAMHGAKEGFFADRYGGDTVPVDPEGQARRQRELDREYELEQFRQFGGDMVPDPTPPSPRNYEYLPYGSER